MVPRLGYDSLSGGRHRSQTCSVVCSQRSRSSTPDRRGDYDNDDDGASRGRSPPRRSERYQNEICSPSRGRSFSRSRDSRSWSRGLSRSRSPVQLVARSTKIVVERLTKNVVENHLWEIFGTYGEIEDLDLPLSKQYGTNRGTAYILYYNEADAESAIAHMHEANIDGAVINVSIVLPRRKFSRSPPTQQRGANIDPRAPPPHSRHGPSGASLGDGGVSHGGRRPRPPPPLSSTARPSRRRGGPGHHSENYRPRSSSRSRSRSPLPVPEVSRRYRTHSRSYSSRSRSRTPPARRRRDGGRNGRSNSQGRRFSDDGGRDRYRSLSRGSYDSYDRRSVSRNR